jgi:hypothetical protein
MDKIVHQFQRTANSRFPSKSLQEKMRGKEKRPGRHPIYEQPLTKK